MICANRHELAHGRPQRCAPLDQTIGRSAIGFSPTKRAKDVTVRVMRWSVDRLRRRESAKPAWIAGAVCAVGIRSLCRLPTCVLQVQRRSALQSGILNQARGVARFVAGFGHHREITKPAAAPSPAPTPAPNTVAGQHPTSRHVPSGPVAAAVKSTAPAPAPRSNPVRAGWRRTNSLSTAMAALAGTSG